MADGNLADVIRRRIRESDGQEFSFVIELSRERRSTGEKKEVQPSAGGGPAGEGTAPVQ